MLIVGEERKGIVNMDNIRVIFLNVVNKGIGVIAEYADGTGEGVTLGVYTGDGAVAATKKIIADYYDNKKICYLPESDIKKESGETNDKGE